jgi:hypothetical protein
VLLRHRSDLRPSSPPLHKPQADALHLFSGLPSPVPHRRFASPLWAHHGEPLRRLCPKSGPSPPWRAPWHLLPWPLAAGRPDKPRASGEWVSSPVSAERAERPKWVGLFSPAGPSATACVAHCNSAIFLLSFELFKIQFKFSLNSEICRELNKLDKILILILLFEIKLNLWNKILK